jgi:hypothetical protein
MFYHQKNKFYDIHLIGWNFINAFIDKNDIRNQLISSIRRNIQDW